MNEPKESDDLADKLVVKDTFEISAKGVKEFDSLLVEIKKKQEQFPHFSMDIVCEWDTMEAGFLYGNDKRQLKLKNLHSGQWNMFVNRVMKIEKEIITYLNEGKPEDVEQTIPIFSCNVKLRIEFKDKDAENALKEPEQLSLFTPVGDLAQSYFREKNLLGEAIELRKEIKYLKLLNAAQEDGTGFGEERITDPQEYARIHGVDIEEAKRIIHVDNQMRQIERDMVGSV